MKMNLFINPENEAKSSALQRGATMFERGAIMFEQRATMFEQRATMFEQEATLLEQGAIMFEQEGFLGNIQKSPLKFGVSVCFLPKNQTKFAFGWFPKYTKV